MYLATSIACKESVPQYNKIFHKEDRLDSINKDLAAENSVMKYWEKVFKIMAGVLAFKL
jgi:hypothetical protein